MDIAQVDFLELETAEESNKSTVSPSFNLDVRQLLLDLLVPFVTMLSGGGYIVIISFLAPYNSSHTFQVLPIQYLTAGFGLVVITLLSVLIFLIIGGVLSLAWRRIRSKKYDLELRPVIRLGWLVFLVILVLVAIAIASSINTQSAADFAVRVVIYYFLLGMVIEAYGYIVGETVFQNRRTESVSDTLQVIILSLSYAAIVGWIYGSMIYGSIPRSLLGGQPVSATVSMTEASLLSTIGLHTSENRIESVCILADLTNGILVYQPATKLVVAIQSELAYSILRGNGNCTPPRPDN